VSFKVRIRHEYRGYKMSYHDVNSRNETSYKYPLKVVNGYRLWFREYVPSPKNNLLVGLAMAWTDINCKPVSEARYFASPCGFEYVGEYYKGGDLLHWDEVSTTVDSSDEELQKAYDDAMKRLEDHMEAQA
jgi:hypothetical protein